MLWYQSPQDRRNELNNIFYRYFILSGGGQCVYECQWTKWQNINSKWKWIEIIDHFVIMIVTNYELFTSAHAKCQFNKFSKN